MNDSRKYVRRLIPGRRTCLAVVILLLVALVVAAAVQLTDGRGGRKLADRLEGTWTCPGVDVGETMPDSSAVRMSARYGKVHEVSIISYAPVLTFETRDKMKGGVSIMSADVRVAMPVVMTDSIEPDSVFLLQASGTVRVSVRGAWVAHGSGEVTVVVDPESMVAEIDSAAFRLRGLGPAADIPDSVLLAIAPGYIPEMRQAAAVRIQDELAQLSSFRSVRTDDRTLSFGAGKRNLTFSRMHPSE